MARSLPAELLAVLETPEQRERARAELAYAWAEGYAVGLEYDDDAERPWNPWLIYCQMPSERCRGVVQSPGVLCAEHRAVLEELLADVNPPA